MKYEGRTLKGGRKVYRKKIEINPKVKFFIFGFVAGFFTTVILMNCIR